MVNTNKILKFLFALWIMMASFSAFSNDFLDKGYCFKDDFVGNILWPITQLDEEQSKYKNVVFPGCENNSISEVGKDTQPPASTVYSLVYVFLIVLIFIALVFAVFYVIVFLVESFLMASMTGSFLSQKVSGYFLTAKIATITAILMPINASGLSILNYGIIGLFSQSNYYANLISYKYLKRYSLQNLKSNLSIVKHFDLNDTNDKYVADLDVYKGTLMDKVFNSLSKDLSGLKDDEFYDGKPESFTYKVKESLSFCGKDNVCLYFHVHDVKFNDNNLNFNKVFKIEVPTGIYTLNEEEKGILNKVYMEHPMIFNKKKDEIKKYFNSYLKYVLYYEKGRRLSGVEDGEKKIKEQNGVNLGENIIFSSKQIGSCDEFDKKINDIKFPLELAPQFKSYAISCLAKKQKIFLRAVDYPGTDSTECLNFKYSDERKLDIGEIDYVSDFYDNKVAFLNKEDFFNNLLKDNEYQEQCINKLCKNPILCAYMTRRAFETFNEFGFGLDDSSMKVVEDYKGWAFLPINVLGLYSNDNQQLKMEIEISDDISNDVVGEEINVATNGNYEDYSFGDIAKNIKNFLYANFNTIREVKNSIAEKYQEYIEISDDREYSFDCEDLNLSNCKGVSFKPIEKVGFNSGFKTIDNWYKKINYCLKHDVGSYIKIDGKYERCELSLNPMVALRIFSIGILMEIESLNMSYLEAKLTEDSFEEKSKEYFIKKFLKSLPVFVGNLEIFSSILHNSEPKDLLIASAPHIMFSSLAKISPDSGVMMYKTLFNIIDTFLYILFFLLLGLFIFVLLFWIKRIILIFYYLFSTMVISNIWITSLILPHNNISSRGYDYGVKKIISLFLYIPFTFLGLLMVMLIIIYLPPVVLSMNFFESLGFYEEFSSTNFAVNFVLKIMFLLLEIIILMLMLLLVIKTTLSVISSVYNGAVSLIMGEETDFTQSDDNDLEAFNIMKNYFRKK